jgi:hypothetical protein
MAAIVKANTSLTAGGLAILKRTFATTDRGQVTYSADYVCLAQFAANYAPRFRSGAEPPTPIPSSMLLLNLTRTPTLVDLQTETVSGLTYFKAQYSAGVETDLVITTTSETRSVAWRTITNDLTRASSFDYISVSVTATGTNQTIPVVRGGVGAIFNTRNVNVSSIENNRLPNVARKTIESTRQTRTQRGDYENSVTSSGVYEAEDLDQSRPERPPTTTTPRPPISSFNFSRQTQNTSFFG